MHIYDISENDAGQRLDSFLKKIFPNATRGLIYKLNRKGNIKVIAQNTPETTRKGAKQDNEYKLQVGERVQVFLSEKDIRELTQKKETGQELQKSEKLEKKDIIYEDGDLLVLNKNAGINVHPGNNKTTEVSLIQQVEDHYSGKLSSLTFKPSLVHRIDRDTSGILVIAKKKPALLKMSADFKQKTLLKKGYFCIVLGKLSRPQGTIKKPLSRRENAKNEAKVQVSDSGQEAITHYKVLREYILKLPKETIILSTLEIEIETGRMHQIRVHLAHIGNPILGDKNYGDKRLNAYFAKNFGVTRQMLHAWKLSFTHPTSKKAITLTAHLKADMELFLEKLGSHEKR